MISEKDFALLRWYWTELDGDCGLRSSMGAFIARLETGVSAPTTGGGDGPAQHNLDAVERAHRVEARLSRAGRNACRVLKRLVAGRPSDKGHEWDVLTEAERVAAGPRWKSVGKERLAWAVEKWNAA